jgi:peptidyl-prolyl cis-trans isomerase SurA
MKKLTIILVGITAACSSVKMFNSSKDQPLVKIANEPVMTDEFIYAFNKNRPADSVASTPEIDEYLNLYINFKLKVAEANSRGMDTTAEFIKEYTSYIDQLDNSYLQSGNDTEELVQEAYSRLQFEIRASHILFSVKRVPHQRIPWLFILRH